MRIYTVLVTRQSHNKIQQVETDKYQDVKAVRVSDVGVLSFTGSSWEIIYNSHEWRSIEIQEQASPTIEKGR